MWAVTRRGNRLVEMLGVALEQVEENFGWSLSRVESRFLRPQGSGSRCGRPQQPAANQIAAEDLSHLSQLVRPRFQEDVQQTPSPSRLSSSRTAATAPAWRPSVASTCRPPER